MTQEEFDRQRPAKVGAIIVAAGRSVRMGGGDKIWIALSGRPLVAHTLSIFQYSPAVDRIALVVSYDKLKLGQTLAKGGHLTKVVSVCAGGAQRQESVRAGLEALGPCEWVIVHDGARPLVTSRLIEQGLAAAKETGAATCAVPIQDSVKSVTEKHVVDKSLDRSRLWLIQTPQVFRYNILVEAHKAAARSRASATDDATLVERLGNPVKVYMGSYHNIKITTPEDLVLAGMFLRWHRE